MSNETDAAKLDPEDEFWELVDGFIQQANQNLKEIPASKVKAAMIYAAARFNAFIVAVESGSQQNLMQQKWTALDLYTRQYHKMLEENLMDYQTNFDQYLRPQQPSSSNTEAPPPDEIPEE